MSEYLKVIVENENDIPAIIDGERNGFIGHVLVLDEGYVMVSADIVGAETRTIELKDTTSTQPMEVVINVQD